MTALLTPPDATPADSEPPVREFSELIRVHANLLPEEIIAARRLVHLKRRLGIGLAALVVLLALGFGYSWWQTNNAQDDLTAEQSRSLAMTGQIQQYAPLVEAQAKTSQLQGEIATAMTGDVQWSRLIATLNKSTSGTLAVTSIDGVMDAASATVPTGGDSTNPLNNSGLQVVGSLTITGKTPDYKSVAAFVETLSKVRGLAVVDPGSVSSDSGGYTFTVTLSLTTDALGGRFTSKVAPAAPATTSSAPTTGGN
jgi:Tfp pilus assembly protein PilN